MKPKQTVTPENGDFESSLATLESIVRELESGDLPLERSLQLFEQGVRLSRECQEKLNEADQRIEVLLRGADGRPIVANLNDGKDADEGLADESDEDEDDDDDVF